MTEPPQSEGTPEAGTGAKKTGEYSVIAPGVSDRVTEGRAGMSPELEQIRKILVGPLDASFQSKLSDLDRKIDGLRTRDSDAADMVGALKTQLGIYEERLRTLQELVAADLVKQMDSMAAELSALRAEVSAEIRELQAVHQGLEKYVKAELLSQVSEARNTAGVLPEMLVEIADKLRSVSSIPHAAPSPTPNAAADLAPEADSSRPAAVPTAPETVQMPDPTGIPIATGDMVYINSEQAQRQGQAPATPPPPPPPDPTSGSGS